MTNTPGWASPGSSDSPEPEDGDHPSSTPTPTTQESPVSAESPVSSESPDSPEDAPPASPRAQGSGWSAQQPPAGRWEHTPGGPPAGGAPDGVPGPAGGHAGPTGPQGPAAPPGGGWGQWAPPQGPQAPRGAPYAGGPRWGSTAPGWQHQGGWGRPAVPKPGVIPLRPLGAGEILDGAIATLRLNWRTILGFTLVIALLTQGVGVVVQGLFLDDTRLKNLRDNPDPSVSDILHALRGALAGSGLALLVVLFATIIAGALLAMVTSRAVLGRTVTAGDAWRDARPRLRSLLGLTLLIPLALVAILAVSVLPGALIALAGAEDGGGALAFLGLVGGMVVVIWIAVQWSLAAPALMLERQGVIGALKRSAKLVRGAWWRVLGVQLLALLLVNIAASIIQVPFMLLAGGVTNDSFGSFLSSDSNPSWTFLIITGVGAAIGSMFTLPISAAVTSLLYMDQRIRREALDIELTRAANKQ